MDREKMEKVTAAVAGGLQKLGCSAKRTGTVSLLSCAAAAAAQQLEGAAWCPHGLAHAYGEKHGKTMWCVWTAMDRALKAAGVGLPVGKAIRWLALRAVKEVESDVC